MSIASDDRHGKILSRISFRNPPKACPENAGKRQAAAGVIYGVRRLSLSPFPREKPKINNPKEK